VLASESSEIRSLGLILDISRTMNDSENIFDVISAIQQGDYEVVSQAIDQGHVAATAHDKAGSEGHLLSNPFH
jgi:hypothetical protein